MDTILAHEAVIADLLTRPIPTEYPDLIDVLLSCCARYYGEAEARERAVDYLRQQQAKGLATYGVGLTVDIPIDPVVEKLQELVDACCYEWVEKTRSQM